MFGNFLNFMKGKDFLSQVLEEFQGMLDKTEFMFKAVCDTLLENVQNPDLRETVYSLDREVNALQKDIRKRIVAHLSLQPTVDVSSCLLLMSVVKDAERIGDYIKNLYEVIPLLHKPLDKQRYRSYFNDVDQEIKGMFEQTKKAFVESDDNQALSSWEHKTHISRMCNDILVRLAKSDLQVNEGICLALIARYFKRVSSHLVNIATSVILPLSELDYFDEKRAKE